MTVEGQPFDDTGYPRPEMRSVGHYGRGLALSAGEGERKAAV